MRKDQALEALPIKANPAHRYRDELNFAEFPIASVSDTTPDGVKTLEFTDEIFDPSSGKTVTRTLVVTGADKFGLPTALDNEVLLGLMQLSCEENFADRKVHFSRYELIKLLGWRDESKSYKRIEESLNRWTGVTLQYRKAWWSKEEQCWVNETFHVIDQVTVFDRERIERRRKMAKDSPDKALSSFVWNETVFQSFKAGYIKSLDFDFFKSLRSAISKQMFRFLDKRFYHKPRWEFELRAFACEHVGLSKNYSNSELKRKLLPAVRELEERGFLVPLSDDERFRKVEQGKWLAVFVKATSKVSSLTTDPERERLASDLVSRGLTPRSAGKLVARYAKGHIEEKLRLFDELRKTGGEGRIRNRAGWLYSAIVNDFAAPTAATPPSQPESHQPAALTAPAAPASSEETSFDAFWATLTNDAQDAFEEEAVAATSPFLQRQYRDGKAQQGSLWRAARRQILIAHFSTRSRTAAGDDPGAA